MLPLPAPSPLTVCKSPSRKSSWQLTWQEISQHVVAIFFKFVSGFEMHYDGIEPKIFAEELIKKIKHYEVLCFNGEPKYICIKYFQDKNFHISWYNTDFQLENFKLEYDAGKTAEIDINKAKEIIELSKKLSNGFKLVRCDFEISNNSKIYFEEMTFTPYSGFRNFEPREYNYIIGDLLKLEN